MWACVCCWGEVLIGEGGAVGQSKHSEHFVSPEIILEIEDVILMAIDMKMDGFKTQFYIESIWLAVEFKE